MRPGFTLVEMLVVIILISVSGVIMTSSLIRSRETAIFQSEFQDAMLLVQEARSKAQAPTEDETIDGYGVRYRRDNNQQQIELFFDKDNNGLLTTNDQVDQQINLSDSANLAMAIVATRPQSQGQNLINYNAFTIYFPKNQLGCQLKMNIVGAPTGIDLEKLEVAFAVEEADFTSMLAADPHQLLTIHHLGCVPEISQNRLK